MPNWCENRWTFAGPDADAILDLLAPEGTHFDFNRVIPMPPLLSRIARGFSTIDGVSVRNWIQEEGQPPRRLTPEEEAECAELGYADWYDWAHHNWGTKWGTGPINVTEDSDDFVVVVFDTAWSPPQPIVEALRERFPDTTITAFYDEPGCEMAGYL